MTSPRAPFGRLKVGDRVRVQPHISFYSRYLANEEGEVVEIRDVPPYREACVVVMGEKHWLWEDELDLI